MVFDWIKIKKRNDQFEKGIRFPGRTNNEIDNQLEDDAMQPDRH